MSQAEKFLAFLRMQEERAICEIETSIRIENDELVTTRRYAVEKAPSDPEKRRRVP